MSKAASTFTAESKRVPGRSEFAKWWAEAEPDLLRMALGFGLGDNARDIVQDVAVLALMQSERFSEFEEFKKWARARIHWLSLDELTRRRRLGTDLDDVIATVRVGPTQEQMTTAAELRKCVQKLPNRQREAMKRCLQGKSVTEIARELGIVAATVRSLLRFARRALFRQLSEGER
jgi:RNA polymerase sigma factor (sigma-70 family)